MTRDIDFIKVTAQGNNYIYIDNRKETYQNIDFNNLSKAVSDIRFGIGSDGLVVMNEDADKETDCFMRIFNSDGSEAKMCGNALRSVAYLLAEESKKTNFTIGTLSGTKKAKVDLGESTVIVEMGLAKVITSYSSDRLKGNVIDIGNQHLIINNDKAKMKREDFLHLAEDIQCSNDFPDGINVELIEIISPERIKAIVYERGSGLTYACGSGASAIFWDCYKQRLVESTVTIELDGGDVRISYKNNNINLEGQVREVCHGTFKWSL